MKIPKQIVIGVTTYEIKECDKIPGPGNDSALAFIEYDKGIIWISRGNQNEQIRQLSFLHEIVHGMLAEISEEKLRKDERFVDLLARQLYVLLEKNDL